MKKSKIGKKIKVKPNCSCKGNCKFRINNKKLNNFTIDYCSENIETLAYTKEFDV